MRTWTVKTPRGYAETLDISDDHGFAHIRITGAEPTSIMRGDDETADDFKLRAFAMFYGQLLVDAGAVDVQARNGRTNEPLKTAL